MQPLVRDNIRLAATVMLVRDAIDGLEVYMVQRPGKGAFPDLHVFPGGKVDADDLAPQICIGIDDQEASQRLGLAQGGLRYWVAMARECFEECGVLLAHQHGQPIDLTKPAVGMHFDSCRRALLAGEISFSALCAREDLTIRCDLLAYFSHWITPDSAPRRFDTRFFLAAMPEFQDTAADTEETTDDQWERPSEALAHHANSTWQMIDPTLRSLETLSRYDTVAQALAGVIRADHLMPLTEKLTGQGMQPLR